MYKAILAIRYLFKRRISYFSLAAVALCVFVVLVVITVLSGLTSEFKKNTYRSVGDCVISTKSLVGFPYYDEFISRLEKESIVQAASPVIKNYAMVKSTESLNGAPYIDRTLEVMGVEPITYSRVTGFADWLVYNKADAQKAFTQSYDANAPGCVMGIGFLFQRDSQGQYIIPDQKPTFKVEISCVPLTAKGALANVGTTVVNTKDFAFSDCAKSGISIDWKTIYLPFDQVQILCGMGMEPKRTNEIFIKFEPDVKLSAGCQRVSQLWRGFVEEKADARYANLLGKVKVQSWKIYSRDIVAVAETQQMLMIMCFAMIAVITVFIVFVVFYMIVSHKSKDIGILKSVGVSSGNILVLFLSFAFLVAVLGSIIGSLCGWQFLVYINQIEDCMFERFGIQLFDRTIYAIGDIPNVIDIKVLAGIIISAIATCLIGAVIPSWQAARLKPIETLQVNQL